MSIVKVSSETVIWFYSQILSDYTLMVVVAGTALMGIISGVLGCFAILRRQSLLGDTISHAALPGITTAFMVTLTKNPMILIGGAIIAGLSGALLVRIIIANTKIKQDTALGIVLSVFFGFGIVQLTMIQNLPNASQAGLTHFLFGSASSMLLEDVWIMLGFGVVIFICIVACFKEFKSLTFDFNYVKTLGFPVERLDMLLTAFMVVAIVLGLQTVGVVLMSAMLIAPAVAARQWTDKLSLMLVISGFFGAVSGLIGALLSSSISKLPTGPAIVLVVSAIVLISLFLSPNRGLLFNYIRQLKNKHNIQKENMLTNLLMLSHNHSNPYHPHNLEALKVLGLKAFDSILKELKAEGKITHIKTEKKWAFTKEGYTQAVKLQKQRMENPE